MQQPGLQQAPAGWPAMPGLQSPLASQAPQFPPNPAQFPPGTVPQQGAPSYPGQSYTVYPPQAQPGAQPGFPHQFQAPQPAPQYQPPYQGHFQPAPQQQYQPPQAQAPGVAPVAFPSSPYGSQPPAPGQQPPSPAQMLARQLTDVARTLEQLFPGYQIVQSILLDLSTSGHPHAGIDDAARSLKDALYYHGATLGAIRRLLIGETNPAVLTGLAAAIQSLNRAQSQARPLLERLIQAGPASARGAAANAAQTLTTSDVLLGQATGAIQALVGPGAWETARSRMAETAT